MSSFAIARQLLSSVKRRRKVDVGARILTYHGVIEAYTDPRVERSFHLLEEFRAHVAILRRLRVVSLDELEGETDRPWWPRVAITFDDGFRNNLLAAEILAEAKLPATIFVATDNVARQEPIWPIYLRAVLARGSARRISISGEVYELDRDPSAFDRVRQLFKAAPSAEWRARWDELTTQLRPGELAEIAAAFPSIAMMTREDAASLAASGIAVGSHGSSHELHHAHQPRELRLRELVDSKAWIERATARPCRHFAFPNGTFCDSSPHELRTAGYRHGFTTVSRAVAPSDNPMLLPRIMVGRGTEKLVPSLVFGN